LKGPLSLKTRGPIFKPPEILPGILIRSYDIKAKNAVSSLWVKEAAFFYFD
jgi:hypothetical protein